MKTSPSLMRIRNDKDHPKYPPITQNASSKKLKDALILPPIKQVKKESILERVEEQRQFMRLGNLYTYYVDRGNNSDLVKRVLSTRRWLVESTSSGSVNFRWKQTSKDLNFSNLLQSSKRTCFNHLEHHQEISNKMKLYENLEVYSQKNGLRVNDLVPITFIINLDSGRLSLELKNFMDYFLKMDKQSGCRNIWLLKPPDLNRGQGIQLFNSLRTFIEQLEEITRFKESGRKEKCRQAKSVQVSFPGEKQVEKMNFIIEENFSSKERVVVVQKYLENPMLFEGRKWDIRVWVLVDHELNYYFFKEGYLRLSSEQFSLSDLSNLYIHLTNNAIQKFHSNYGKHQLGNQISFHDFSKANKVSIDDTLLPKMKDLVRLTMKCARDRMRQCTKQYQFEIFGYDFMVDVEFNVFLIEINSNPCLEESSPLLKKIVPRMINDAFRLTIDKIFASYSKQQRSWDEFEVPGYRNDEIVWDFLGKIE